MNMPLLPRAICRDDTEHGKLYYTRAQMIEYGRKCADEARANEDRAPTRSKAVDDLFEKFGMKK